MMLSNAMTPAETCQTNGNDARSSTLGISNCAISVILATKLCMSPMTKHQTA